MFSIYDTKCLHKEQSRGAYKDPKFWPTFQEAIQKFKDNERTYLQAYCHKRKSERIFLTRRIVSVKAVDKDRTKTNIGKPNLKVDFSLD